MPLKTISTCVVGVLCLVGQVAATAATIEAVRPRTCQPGETTKLIIHGKDLQEPIRLATNAPGVTWKVEKVEPTQAVVDLTIPPEHALGPLHLWVAGPQGPAQAHTLLVDDLEAVTDNGNNHSRETAQAIPSLASVEGTCDASKSDYYRLHAAAGQRLTVEVHTQGLRSAMDPVCRVWDSAGNVLVQADDTQVGPDVRFQFEAPSEGDYWLEIHDSRNAAGGAPYQLRVGDFPLVSQSFPLAVQIGQAATISFIGPDADVADTYEVPVAAVAPHMTTARARRKEGKSSTWIPLYSSRFPQFVESASEETLTVPIGISGRLESASQVDSYSLQGTQGQAVRFTSRTRSLNSPALLQMRLVSSTGAVVAETKVSDSDEWSMDATFPEDGQYRLEVSDLLKRGGAEFGYWVEVAPAGTFAVSRQGDANTPEQFAVLLNQGACAVDLTVSRFGFEGEIELSLANPAAGIRLLNPRIAAQAQNARVYLVADESWSGEQLEVVQLIATAVGDPANACVVDSHAIRRLKEPFVLSPPAQLNGTIALAAAPATTSPFALEPAAPIQWARPVAAHTAVMNLKRPNAEFKAGVEVLGHDLPEGWSVTAQAENDTYTLSLNRNHSPTAQPETLPLLVYGEFQGAGRLEKVDVPVAWFDPLRVELEFPETLVRGGAARVQAKLTREGNDPQAVTLSLVDLPAGITGPEPITIPADQTTAELEIQVAAEAPLDTPLSLTVQAASKFQEQDFTITSAHDLPKLLEGPQQLTVYPAEITLDDRRSRQQIVVVEDSSEQASRDWTRHARVVSSHPEIAEVRGGVVYPVANGETEVSIQVGSVRQTIAVRVSQMETPRRIEFESEVLVAISKQGCNTGACHGSPSGKGNFRLSLRAFDKQLDELTLIHEEFGRRVNLLEPEKSLLLEKPLMNVSHGGGKQLHKEDEAYTILHDWIAAGAGPDPADTPRVVRLEVFPGEKKILSVADGGQQLAVTAHFADGRTRDVTHLVAYETSDTSVAEVNSGGLVTPVARGEVVVLVRMLEYIESVPLMFVEQQPGFQWTAPAPNNYIDELVNIKLKQLQYLPAEICSDAEFLRRVHLDVLGVLPTVEETTAFLADTAEDKRARLIDELLERDEYAKFWALKWGDLLKMTSKQVGADAVHKYHRWVQDALKSNMPYDQFATELLTGSGSTLANPPANFYHTSADMHDRVETISQVFLGARLQCAKCHNHPFERWTQDNYYGLGAFFNRVQRRKTSRPGEMFIYTTYAGEVTQPRTGQVMQPWLPQVGSIERNNEVDQRMAFAQWLVSPDNPYFARIEANRIWSQLFARGIVDPIDDFRDSNPPVNAPLLDALAKDFVDSGFDRKHLLRTILSSRTYQASHETGPFNRDDTTYFSHQEPRLLGAEQLLDAINHTLDLKQTLGNLPEGTRATQMPAPDLANVEFLKVFGQPERSTVCACERSSNSNLGMAIELLNGPLIHEKLKDENNRFRKGVADGKEAGQVIRELYLAALCRPPSDVELQVGLEHCTQSADVAAGLEDICWALFNSDEFLFQH